MLTAIYELNKINKTCYYSYLTLSNMSCFIIIYSTFTNIPVVTVQTAISPIATYSNLSLQIVLFKCSLSVGLYCNCLLHVVREVFQNVFHWIRVGPAWAQGYAPGYPRSGNIFLIHIQGKHSILGTLPQRPTLFQHLV